MDDSTLLDLYKTFIKEQWDAIEGHQKRLQYFSGLISALVGGTVVGLVKVSKWYEFLVLALGPLLIFVVSSIGRRGAFRFYQIFLEAE